MSVCRWICRQCEEEESPCERGEGEECVATVQQAGGGCVAARRATEHSDPHGHSCAAHLVHWHLSVLR